jgi:hypothetical protein
MPIRFKVTDQDYDYIDRALIDAGLSVEADIRVREMLDERGLPAAIGLIAGEKVAKKLKAAPPGDEFDQLGQQIAAAARAHAMTAGADREQVVQHLQSVIAQLSPTGGRSKLDDQGAQTTKAHQPDVLQTIIQGDLSGWGGR